MLFPSQCYSLLLVSCSERFNETVLGLCKSYCDPIRVVPSVNAAKRAVLDQSYDLVLLNAPLPDGQGMDLAAELSAGRQTICLLLLRAQEFKLLQSRAEEQGVSPSKSPPHPGRWRPRFTGCSRPDSACAVWSRKPRVWRRKCRRSASSTAPSGC